ncbi:MAG: hypothetical protein ABJN36_11965 [Cyclobacteriaceae bacterium]
MRKEYRYIVYLGIGVMLYFLMGGEEGDESIQKIHEKAPAIIIAVAIILVVLGFIKKQREKRGGK